MHPKLDYQGNFSILRGATLYQIYLSPICEQIMGGFLRIWRENQGAGLCRIYQDVIFAAL